MQQIISSSNITFISNDFVLYDLQQTGSTGVLIRLTSDELTETSSLPQLSTIDVSDNISLYNEETKLFIPSCELLYYVYRIILTLSFTLVLDSRD